MREEEEEGQYLIMINPFYSAHYTKNRGAYMLFYEALKTPAESGSAPSLITKFTPKDQLKHIPLQVRCRHEARVGYRLYSTWIFVSGGLVVNNPCIILCKANGTCTSHTTLRCLLIASIKLSYNISEKGPKR